MTNSKSASEQKIRLKAQNEKNPKGIFSPMHPNFSGAEIAVSFQAKSLSNLRTMGGISRLQDGFLCFLVFCVCSKAVLLDTQITRSLKEKRLPYFFLVCQ